MLRSMTQTICDDMDVLLVDDEEIIGEIIGDRVKHHGCQHISFNNPTKALQYYIANAPIITLIITDLTMPVVPGPRLIRNVLRISPKLPIILLTGYAEEHIPDDIGPLIERVLPKPFVKSHLLLAVRTALRKADHQHLSSNRSASCSAGLTSAVRNGAYHESAAGTFIQEEMPG
jgi:DNA-binding NtrC family response regulator